MKNTAILFTEIHFRNAGTADIVFMFMPKRCIAATDSARFPKVIRAAMQSRFWNRE
jgi:hypothetical protein